MLEQMQQAGKIEVTHVPYKGAGQQLTDALGGQFELISTNMSPALTSHIADGTFTPLAIAAPARIDPLPNVPTFSELRSEERRVGHECLRKCRSRWAALLEKIDIKLQKC